jgi:hypothetical protein
MQLPEVVTSISEEYTISRPIIVAAQSKAWTAFARSNIGVAGSNPIQNMYVCVRYSVCK